MSTSSTSMFTGSSRYATDFQNVISRAVAIASLPMSLMNSQKTTLESQSTALTSLNSKTAALETAIKNLATATGASSYSSSVSDGTILSVSLDTGVTPATYTVEVTNLGAYNNAMSVDGATKVTDPANKNISTATHFTLSTTEGSYSFDATSLSEMAEKINDSGFDVQASIVNVGSASSPDYRLSVQATKLGAMELSLKDDATPTPNELLSTVEAGEKAEYKVNGYATATQSDTRTVEISPGLTVNLLKESATGVATTIKVTRSTNSVQDALGSFVTAYNAVVDELDQHRGEAKGALAGDSILYTVDQMLSDLQSYSPGSGSLSSLESLGVKYSTDGKLTLDSTVFQKATSGNVDDLMSFLGGTTTGGFLKTATDALDSLANEDTGALTNEISSVKNQISTQTDRISAEQDRIDDLQKMLEEQMAAADALIAQMEQQAQYLNNMFAAMSEASKQYSA